MTYSPPEEATHFRGKTLSPESPRPLHIPEPQNIPVLQNQIDPHFNLMSTHIAQPSIAQHGITSENLPQDYYPGAISHNPRFTNTDTEGTIHGDVESMDGGLQSHHNHAYALTEKDESSNKYAEADTPHIDTNQGDNEYTASPGFHEILSDPATNAPATLSSDQDRSSNALAQDATNNLGDVQDAFVTQSRTALSPGSDPGPISLPPNVDQDVISEGVNFQALLDNLSPASSSAPPAENITSISTATRSRTPIPLSPNSLQTPIATLPIPAGLPARPPPQEKPAIHPNYTPGEDIRSYHKPPTQSSNTSASYNTQANNPQRPPQGYIHNNGIAPNGMPPPPLATFQQSMPNTQRSPQTQQFGQTENRGRKEGSQTQDSYENGDHYSKRPDIDRSYEQFLKDEAVYVSEGTWDRFPQGSRLFVGNLFTEKVSKRDIFYVFQRYGKLAQISMKSAYGFVQYHNAESCFQAMQNEEGTEIQGRKIHLEISKPQKNTRNAAATSAGDNLRAVYNRRSRSPDYGRGGSARGTNSFSGGERYDRNAMPTNFGRQVRDEYRPARSPSPRGIRGRDNFRGRERSPARYFRGRSRSPQERNRHYRSRSPQAFPVPDDEANLPIPRRNPRDVPDVQIILVDEVDRTFVGYIQQSFRGRGLRCEILQLPRVSLAAVVKRQILEGVQAVVKIFQKSQNTGKIPLQVYNRSQGVDNVRFDDYEDLDANIAAEIVFRAKSTHIAPAPTPIPAQYSAAPVYGQPQYSRPPQPMPPQYQQHLPQQQQPPPQAGGAPSNLSSLITSLDGPALQKLLGNMSQTPLTPQTPSYTPNPPPQQQAAQPPHQDLASLLSSVARQQPPQQGYQYSAPPSSQQYSTGPTPQQQNPYPSPVLSQTYSNNQPQYGNQGIRPPYQNIPPQSMPPQYQQPGPLPQQQIQGIPAQYQQQNHAGQQNVSEMLVQLAKYRP